jgi:hypothetical protein
VNEYRASGLNQREYCQRSGVKVWTLRYWLKRLRADAVPERGRGREFVEVRLEDCSEAGRTRGDCSSLVYELELQSGEHLRRLRFGSGFNGKEVTTLIAILEGSGC